MKRILIIINNICFLHSHRREIVAAAINAGFEVYIASPPNPLSSEAEYFRKLGAHLVDLPMGRSKFNPLKELQTLFQLFKILYQTKPDLLHSVTMKPNIYTGLVNCFFRIPAVYAVSGLGTVFIEKGVSAWLRRSVIKLCFRLSMILKKNRIIVQNEDDRQELLKAKIATNDQLFLIRGSGVNTELFSPKPKPGGKPIVAFSARLLKQKGIMEFIRAAELLSELHAKFIIIGDIDVGNPSSLTQQQTKELCLDSKIEWWGFRSDMHRALNQIHILCLPSYREGLPKSLIEGAACGLPLITTNVPGCRDVVATGVNGILVEAKSASSLAEAIKTLVANKNLRENYGHASRNRAVKEWRIDQVVKQTIAIYQQVLTKH